MKYITVIIIALLTACGGGGSSSSSDGTAVIEPDYILVGDSRCVHNSLIDSKLCISGEGIMNIKGLPQDYDIVIMHLGINDMIFIGPTQYELTSKLDAMLSGINDKVWCVLPSWFNYRVGSEIVQMYREAMLYSCTNTVDPNIDPYYGDGVHFDDVNYQQVYDFVQDIKKPS